MLSKDISGAQERETGQERDLKRDSRERTQERELKRKN